MAVAEEALLAHRKVVAAPVEEAALVLWSRYPPRVEAPLEVAPLEVAPPVVAGRVVTSSVKPAQVRC